MHKRAGWHSIRLLVAALALVCFLLPSQAADNNSALKKRALALNELTGNLPIEGEIQRLKADKKATKDLLHTAREMAQGANQPFNYNAAYVLARAAEELRDFDTSGVFYHICISEAKKVKSSHELSLGYAGVLEVLYDAKKYDKALEVCREILELKGSGQYVRNLKTIAHKLQIQTLAKQGKIKDALKLADNQLAATPDDWTFLELKAVVLHDAGRDAEAAKTYEQLMERIPKDPNLDKDTQDVLVARCRYILSGLYIDLDNVEQAVKQLKILLEQRPNDPTYNNDLGYIWADHNMNLAEAERMIRKALTEDRKRRRKDPDLMPIDDHDNAAYLDSLGWVLFKEHKYDEAIKNLVQATADQTEGQSSEIYDHLGEVYMADGKRSEAIAAWKKAIQVAKTKRDQKIKARVEKKLKQAEQAKVSASKQD
ncbi:MAG TPA: tetratricopeptide repeat protein [Gemmataceae bacterium]|nr:tetratricopeptide repeat protein [Gemmataceae bacterium]